MRSRTLIATVVLMLASVACFAQTVQRDSKTAVSGATITFQNARGSSAQSFEYVITGTPTTASIVLSGCMSGGTCDVLETSAATANATRHYALNYDYFTIAPTFSGGSTPTLRANILFSNGVTPSNAIVTKDPCAAASTPKSSAAIAFATATTAALVAPVAGTTAYVCAFSLTMSSGTTPTLKFITGTGATCGTGTVALTGIMALPTASGSLVTVGAGHTTFSSIASGGICIVTAGTTPTGNGWITYVQQ